MNNMESRGPFEPQPIEGSSTPFPPTPEEARQELSEINELRYQLERAASSEERAQIFARLMEKLNSARAVDSAVIAQKRMDAMKANEIMSKN